jgi:hypothetical protein
MAFAAFLVVLCHGEGLPLVGPGVAQLGEAVECKLLAGDYVGDYVGGLALAAALRMRERLIVEGVTNPSSDP